MRIAIIGGGLAGASLANLLVKNCQFSVELFESREFSERGATVGLSRNALVALDRILDTALDILLKNADVIHTESIHVMIGSGSHAGESLFDIPSAKPRISVSRASLLKELLSHLPKEILHPNMKLRSINIEVDGVAITFENGTTDRFDVVIGADGIGSSVRGHVVPEHEHAASPAGFWDGWAAFPIENVRGGIDERFLRAGQQYAFTAEGGLLLYALVGNGTMVQAIVSGLEDPHGSRQERRRLLDEHERKRLISKWDVGNSIIESLLSTSTVYVYSQQEHKTTSAYHRNNICLIGDAAHASTPWQGAGAGQALEDCVILSSLLNAVSNSKDISKAFEAFESVRMPRCKKVIESSREVGTILCGQGGFETLEAWRNALETKWDFLYDFDLETQEREALGLFNSSRTK